MFLELSVEVSIGIPDMAFPKYSSRPSEVEEERAPGSLERDGWQWRVVDERLMYYCSSVVVCLDL